MCPSLSGNRDGILWVVSRFPTPNLDAVIDEAFSEVAESGVCDSGICSWYNDGLRDLRVKSLSSTALSSLSNL